MANDQVTKQIRPGVQRPDWSVVTLSAARDALVKRGIARSRLIDRWSEPLEESQDLVWRTLLELFAAHGRPPVFAEITREIDMAQVGVRSAVRELRARDLVGIDETTDTITHAYPFSERRTGHRVELRGRSLNALCAVDALGVGSMYRCDVTIESACQLCKAGIHLSIKESGKELHSASPDNSVVWYDLCYDESAALSCCPVIPFFCSVDHLQQWLTAQVPKRLGSRLFLDEALQVGQAIFGPVLRVA
jgi:hypothetical protein